MNSLTLDEIQNKFCSAVTSNDDTICLNIHADIKFSGQDRINVYRTNARSLHVSVLTQDYPVCNKILGDDYFRLIAKKYHHKYSSLSFDLNEYGNKLPEYFAILMAERPELKDFLYMADLARLENFIKKSHYAQDSKVFNFNDNLDVLNQDVIFSLRPGVLFQKSHYPVHQLWCMHQKDGELIDLEKSKDVYYLCIYREHYKVHICEIEAHIFDLLQLIQAGKTLSEIISRFNDSSIVNRALEYLLIRNWLRI